MITFSGISDNNDISIDRDGNKTATRQYIYELTGEDIRKPYLVLNDSNLPKKYDRHPSYPQFKATGEKSVSSEGDGGKVIVTCSYTSNILTDVNGNEITSDTAPWLMGLTSWALSSDIVAEVMIMDKEGNPVVSSSGTKLVVMDDVNYPVIDLTYSLEEFKSVWIMNYRGSINAESIVVGGTQLSTKQWKIDNMTAERKITRETNGELKWRYWDVKIRLIGDPVAYKIMTDSGELKTVKRQWQKVVADMSTFMKAEKGGFVPIYAYENRDGDFPGGVKGQVVWSSWDIFKEKFGNKFEEKQNSLERITEPIWLAADGTPAEIDPATGYQKTRYKFFPCRDELDWKPLSMPTEPIGEEA